MFYWLAENFSDLFGPLNVFHYISFRSFVAFLLAFFVLFLVYPRFLRFVKKRTNGGSVREFLDHHGDKRNTPSFGGVPIIMALVLLSFLFMRLDTPYPYLAALTLLLFGSVGLLDDLLKVKGKGGLTVVQKLSLQVPFSLLLGLLIYGFLPVDGALHFPFFKDLVLDLGILYPLWAALVIFATSTAVNLTDGLDGLAIGSTVIAASVLALVAYLTGNYIYANYLYIPYVPYAGELTVLMAALIGAGLAFLWYNAHPAKIFMGDVGSLALGALLGFAAVATQSEFVFFVAGGVFFLELLSVVVQYSVCILTKKGEVVRNDGKRVADCKRVFKMAPLHHHFEKLGWKEPEIVVRFWIISALLAVVSLTFLKLR
ncbi:MAG: phospho-N-acetylmuramoyl-pentapeptide-transferase [Aquificae bacterium]|nr:phospho-N-acetylmuramoyl-pentapeptide-transferase [Aquificota bacterium]